ncbi:hydrophobic surface binding protein A domain-containing protein [Hirsutella rhossiliensis]|uniref:Hydrophobic surface binding protein A domain-containing protein n=1 Tax=Hirsutella rhossiliensis TaxID=111463 RepID=A0A9P8N853_9HYPO|nr:hydrophobic surface binding protein A domain-containing protein [Hirsutella rhossiliensis]KAH0968499.1 hydrophobic surface binding protein A domain-containing protein [Hirsutella rhossiliensis]
MKYSAPLALVCLAAGAFAGPVVERDIKIVTGVLTKVQADIDALVTTVKAFKGDVGGVISKAESLVATINSGTTLVQGSPNLELAEALQLLPAVESLRDHGGILSKELVARRSVVQAAGQCGRTRTQIDHIVSSSSQLVAAFVSKIPQAAQDIAHRKASEITQVLQQAQDDFTPGKC